MNKNIKIAKELIRFAKLLISSDIDIEQLKPKLKEIQEFLKNTLNKVKENPNEANNIFYLAYLSSDDFHNTLDKYNEYLSQNKISLPSLSYQGGTVSFGILKSSSREFSGYIQYSSTVYEVNGIDEVEKLFNYLIEYLDIDKLKKHQQDSKKRQQEENKKQQEEKKKQYKLQIIKKIEDGKSIELLGLSNEAKKRICCLYTDKLNEKIKKRLGLIDPEQEYQYVACTECFCITPFEQKKCRNCGSSIFSDKLKIGDLNAIKKYINTKNSEEIEGDIKVQDIIQLIIKTGYLDKNNAKI